MVVLLALLAVPLHAAGGDASGSVDFNREVKPTLAARCFKCHGGVKRKSGLSLLFRDQATARLRSGKRAIVPGEAAASELLRRVTAEDPDERMPPDGKPLTAEQIDALRRWIAAGAPYDTHWSLVPPAKTTLPRLRDSRDVRGAIDVFIAASLEREGIEATRPADRATLIRRLSLDLIGLPPTIDEIDAFENDRSPDAYERLIDRLLASPRFGERWARRWLDLARYADTQGYEKDNRRTIWRYRDWVIDAFNRDLAYDRFTIEQLAGDLLPDAGNNQLLATAFHRNTMTNTEGGTDDEEFRVAAVMDRVNTTWQVWMGTTFGCVQCHSHPYDPFKHEDYYRFLAFLNNTEDSDKPDERPTVATPTPEQSRRIEALERELASARELLGRSTPELAAARQRWTEQIAGARGWTTPRVESATAESDVALRALDDGSLLVAADASAANDAYTLRLEPGDRGRLTALRLEALPHESLPANGPGRAPDGNFVLSGIAVSVVLADGSEERLVELSRARADFEQKDFPVAHVLSNPDVARHGWAVHPQAGKPHEAVFVASSPVKLAAGDRLVVRLEHRYGQPEFTLGRFRVSITGDPARVAAGDVPPAVVQAASRAPEERTAEESAELERVFRELAPELAPVRTRIAALEKERASIQPPTTPILRELPADRRRTTHVFTRGSFLDPAEAVEPGVPQAMHALDDAPGDRGSGGGASADRLAMARWIASPGNPLTGRVAVNRVWEQLFGIGLVETSEDFGTQGTLPTHPELLDWLAVRFTGDFSWSMKRLLREIVTSAAYRRSSAATPELLACDPKNLLLARGPRLRLEAEMVRDQSLAVSGLLSSTMFGPSVMPPQPDGVWQVVYSGDSWKTSPGADKYRRGLYTFWRRTSPYPSMMAFDATSREYCTIRRLRTNTPLQALVTLNDPVYVEAAQALARRIVREGGRDVASRLRYAFRLCLGRPPVDLEIERLSALVTSELEHFRADADAAHALATSELGPAPEGLDHAELAAWTVVGNVLMNLDEFLTKG